MAARTIYVSAPSLDPHSPCILSRTIPSPSCPIPASARSIAPSLTSASEHALCNRSTGGPARSCGPRVAGQCMWGSRRGAGEGRRGAAGEGQQGRGSRSWAERGQAAKPEDTRGRTASPVEVERGALHERVGPVRPQAEGQQRKVGAAQELLHACRRGRARAHRVRAARGRGARVAAALAASHARGLGSWRWAACMRFSGGPQAGCTLHCGCHWSWAPFFAPCNNPWAAPGGPPTRPGRAAWRCAP